MKFVGFNFKKINIEKKSDSFKGLKLNTKIDISSIDDVKSDFLKGDEKIIKITFSYNINYDPDIAKITLEGNLLLALDKKDAKIVVDSWKNKKMSEEFRIDLFNLILRKSNVRALELEEEMSLPLHLPFPTLKKPVKE